MARRGCLKRNIRMPVFSPYLRHAVGPAVQVASQLGLWAIILLAPRVLEASDAEMLLAVLALTQTISNLCEAGLSNAATPSLLYGDEKATPKLVAALAIAKLASALLLGVPVYLLVFGGRATNPTLALGAILLLVLTIRTPALYVARWWGSAMALSEVAGLILSILILTFGLAGHSTTVVSLLVSVLAIRVGGALVPILAWKSVPLAGSTLSSLMRDVPPYGIHKCLSLASHYSTSSLVITSRGASGLVAYLLAERLFYTGLALWAALLPMFMTLRRASDEAGSATARIAISTVSVSLVVALAACVAIKPIASYMSPENYGEVVNYFTVFMVSFPIVSANYFISAFYLQPEGESWAIAKGAFISALSNALFIVPVLFLSPSPHWYVLSPFVGEGALLAFNLLIMRRRAVRRSSRGGSNSADVGQCPGDG